MSEKLQNGNPDRSRSSARLGSKLDNKLIAYASAASAAGVGVLAVAQPAEAKIVYTPAHVSITQTNVPVYLDINHDGINDFQLLNDFQNFGNRRSWFLGVAGVAPYVGNGVLGNANSASALANGIPIGPRKHFSGSTGAVQGMARIYTSNYNLRTSSGQWRNTTSRYLGLKFSINGQTHYGWARLSVHARVGAFSALLTGYAYETVPNMPIVTGKTTGPSGFENPATFGGSERELASPGLLALGASGITLWRRERDQEIGA